MGPAENTTYTVSDMASGTCLTDVYNVTVGTPTRAITRSAITEEGKPYSLRVQPTVVKKGQPVRVQTNASNVTEVAVVDVSGRIIQTYRFTGNATVETKQLRAGIYFLQLIGNKKSETQKVVVVE